MNNILIREVLVCYTKIMNTLRRLVSRYRLHTLILLPVLAFSFIGYKVFNADATTVPTFIEYLGKTPSLNAGDHLATFDVPNGVTIDASGNMYVVDGTPRIQKFNASGELTLSFGAQGIGDGEFNNPRDVAVDDSGNIYVADSGNGRIQKFNSAGTYVAKWAPEKSAEEKAEGKFSLPQNAAFDASGNIYVVDYGNNRIQKFNSAGTYLSSFGGYGDGNGQFSEPYDIAIDASGNIYVADSGNNRIQKFDASGNYLLQFGTTGSGDGQFSSFYGISLDTSGNVYVADYGNNRIQKFNSSGTYLSQFGAAGSGDGEFTSPYDVTVDVSGNIYVADYGNNRIQKFNSSGTYLLQFGTAGSGDGELTNPLTTSLDASGNVYVVDYGNHRIQKFSSSTDYISQFGVEGVGNGEFSYPTGISLDATGNLYVVDQDNNRIQKFDSSGNYLSQFGSSGTSEELTPTSISIDSSGNVYVAVDTTNDRIQKFDSSGTYLSEFGSAGSGNGQFDYPKGISFDASGNIYVVDSNNTRIQKFNSSGVYDSQFNTNDGDGDPYDVAIDTSGNIYVTDGGAGIVEKYDSAGTYLSQLGSAGTGDGQHSSPAGIAIDATGNVYVVDSDNDRVQKFNASGTYISKFSEVTPHVFSVSSYKPISSATDSSGNLYTVDAVNNQVKKFDASGNLLLQFGSSGSGNGQFNWPEGVVVDAGGDIYVVDARNNRVQKFDNAGAYLSQFAITPYSGYGGDALLTPNGANLSLGEGGEQFGVGGLSDGNNIYIRGIAIDSSGNIYVTSPGNDHIQKFDSSGNEILQFGTPGSGDGQLNGPTALALDPSGNVYVVDKNNSRIQKFTSSGVYVSQFGTDGGGAPETFISSFIPLASGNIQGITSTDSFNPCFSEFGCGGTEGGEFFDIGGISTDSSGNIYVVDSGNKRVQKFNASGTFLSTWGTQGAGNGQFSTPSGISVDTSGNVYVTDLSNQNIQKFSSSGTYLSSFGGNGSAENGKFYNPSKVTHDASGNIYVADADSKYIQKFDSEGNFLMRFSPTLTNISGIAVDPEGGIYKMDSYYSTREIEKFNSNGVFVENFQDFSLSTESPKGIFIDQLGNVYTIVDDGGENISYIISKYDSSGTKLSELSVTLQGSADGQFSQPSGLTVDEEGNIYVMDTGNRRIQKFDSEGEFITKWGTSGSGNGQFDNPSHIALDASGNVYVSDTGNHRIQKFSSDGTFLASFGTQGAGEGQFDSPQGITVLSDGRIIVADSGNQRVAIWDAHQLQFSSVGASSPTSTTTITWNTSRSASSQVIVSLSSLFSYTTEAINTGTRVTDHTVHLPNMPSCSRLEYRLRSVEADGLVAISPTYTTITEGCTGDAEVTASSTVNASLYATSSLTLSSLTLSIPSDYSTTTNATTTFQALALSPVIFTTEAGSPDGRTRATDDVIHLVALTSATTTLTSFTAPISLTFSYNPASLHGAIESSLAIYRYDGSTWYPLSDCVVDTDAHTVTCTTTHFSDFAVFGTPSVVSSPTTSGASYFVSKRNATSSSGISTSTTALPPVTASSSQSSSTSLPSVVVSAVSQLSSTFPRLLMRGQTGEDVKALQVFLNTHNFILAATGNGSPSNETTFFGPRTERALIKFQEFYAKQILAPLGITKGTGVFGEETRAEVMRR